MEDRKETYNKYSEFPDISYNITKYLMNNNELIWKLLKYNDKDAWKNDSAHPNLTTAQKGALINDGTPDPDHSKFRVFFDVGQDDAWVSEATILRITPSDLIPVNYVTGKITVALECYAHYKINTLSSYRTRVNTIAQQLIETLNGQEVGGLGVLHFDARASNRCKMSVVGQIPFKGMVILMSNWV